MEKAKCNKMISKVYIPPYIVSKLDALSVYDVAERLGIEIVRNHALCFMHDDHHPSMPSGKVTIVGNALSAVLVVIALSW